MKYFLDTEFIERGPEHPITLLSIGIVAEDGREFYAVNADADYSTANDWVKANVLPYLGRGYFSGGAPETLAEIAVRVRKFVTDHWPEFWGYYCDYDWVVFCQMFGTMMDLPKGWPMFCRDIKQLCVDKGNPDLPKQEHTEHNALCDAYWNKLAYEFLLSRHAPQEGRSEVKILASAMRKVLPPGLLQEVIDHCDPKAAFLREIWPAAPEVKP